MSEKINTYVDNAYIDLEVYIRDFLQKLSKTHNKQEAIKGIKRRFNNNFVYKYNNVTVDFDEVVKKYVANIIKNLKEGNVVDLTNSLKETEEYLHAKKDKESTSQIGLLSSKWRRRVSMLNEFKVK